MLTLSAAPRGTATPSSMSSSTADSTDGKVRLPAPMTWEIGAMETAIKRQLAFQGNRKGRNRENGGQHRRVSLGPRIERSKSARETLKRRCQFTQITGARLEAASESARWIVGKNMSVVERAYCMWRSDDALGRLHTNFIDFWNVGRWRWKSA